MTVERTLRKADAQLVAVQLILKEKTNSLERFLIELGHELKTPPAALVLTVDALLTNPNDEARRAAMAEVHYLQQLIENLRLEARLTQGGSTVRLTRFDLRDVIERIVTGLRPLARHLGVSFEAAWAEQAIDVETDRSLVERALTNLVHNALSHGARNVAVTLESREAGFELCIVDDGPGFTATPSARRGDGLGQNIATRALELSRFRLDAGAGPDGVGATMRITPL